MAEEGEVLSYLDSLNKQRQQYRRTKKKILRNNKLSIDDKKQRIRSLEPKPSVGLTLSQLKENLPESDIKPTESFLQLSKTVALKRNKIYESIIRSKLDVLFGTESAEQVMKKVDSEKLELDKLTKRADELKRDYENVVLGAENHQAILDIRLQIENTIRELKESKENKVQIYVDELRPLLRKMMELKYTNSNVTVSEANDVSSEIITLHQEPWSLIETMVSKISS